MECKECGLSLELDSYQNTDGDVIVTLYCNDCDKYFPVKTKGELREILNDEELANYLPVDVIFEINKF